MIPVSPRSMNASDARPQTSRQSGSEKVFLRSGCIWAYGLFVGDVATNPGVSSRAKSSPARGTPQTRDFQQLAPADWLPRRTGSETARLEPSDRTSPAWRCWLHVIQISRKTKSSASCNTSRSSSTAFKSAEGGLELVAVCAGLAKHLDVEPWLFI